VADPPSGTIASSSLTSKGALASGIGTERPWDAPSSGASLLLWEVIGRYVGTLFMTVGDGGTLSFPRCRRRCPRRDIAAKERMDDGWGSI
jgi:hypothetical protein